MKQLIAILILLGARAALAYEYPLQFTPQGGAEGVTVFGYEFNGKTVVGECNYSISRSGSGRGGHGSTTYYYNTCTWDLHGNPVSVVPTTAPLARDPITTVGTEIIFAYDGRITTGRDTRGFGFVNTPSAHYSWESVNNGYAVISYAPYTITATLKSDGDYPLAFDLVKATTAISGFITPAPGTGRVIGTTCGKSVAIGASCTVTAVYDPTTIKCTGDAYGYAYTRINLIPVTNSGATTEFTEGFTVTGVPICDD